VYVALLMLRDKQLRCSTLLFRGLAHPRRKTQNQQSSLLKAAQVNTFSGVSDRHFMC
jgi:hypothetical protein